MTGPYEYVAPSYWTADPYLRKESACNAGGCGGAYGFNSETSMGPAIPPLETVERMLPKDHRTKQREMIGLVNTSAGYRYRSRQVPHWILLARQPVRIFEQMPFNDASRRIGAEVMIGTSPFGGNFRFF